MPSPTPREIAMEARKREFDAKRRAANRQSGANLLGMASNPGALLRGALDIPGSVYRYVRGNEPVEIGEDVSGLASDMADDFRKDRVKFAVDMINPASSVQDFADVRALARDYRAAGDLDKASTMEQIAAMSPLAVVPVVGKVLGKGAKAAAKRAASLAVKPAEAAAEKASLAVERSVEPYFAPGSPERAANLARAMEGSAVPDPVFHGSYDDISSFYPGTHFGTSASAAQRLADMSDLREGAPNISRVHLFAKNPLRVTDAEASDDATFLKAIAKGKYPDLDLNTARRKGGLRAVKDAGYDALVYRNRMEDAGRDSYVTTSRGQVKSATGNRGTFDKNDPDLNKAHGGRVSPLTVKRKGKK